MKNFKILGVTLSLVLIICNLMNNCVYAQSFDDEDEVEDLAIIDDIQNSAYGKYNKNPYSLDCNKSR